MVKKMQMGLLDAMASGVVRPKRKPDQKLEPAIHFEVRELRETPVIDADHPDCRGNKYGFEGGSVVKFNGTYHLFVSEMAGDPFWIRMRLAHWSSPDGIKWKRQSTIKETSGQPRAVTGLPHESVWAPMPIFNEADNRWDLFYVAYDTGGYVGGRIWRATSTAQGQTGIGGPYKDMGIILQPDRESQKWEGGQGTDSFFPYRVKDRWFAFYGSHGGKPGWQVGLAESAALAGPWKRCAKGNPLSIEPVFIENPVVSRIGDLYVAVYDSDIVHAKDSEYHREAHSVGYATSGDGIEWSAGSRIIVQPPGPANWSTDIRTPLGLVNEGSDKFSLFYTAENKKRFWPVSMVRVKMTTTPTLRGGRAKTHVSQPTFECPA